MEKSVMQKCVCAPVIIPTLNRYDHLKKCVESLQRNQLASQTELFISIDFPPQEKYVEGYERLKSYVDQGIEGFKRVNIYYQKENLGPIRNMNFLVTEALKKYSRFIFSEDDNIFSENYLEYMNLCLEKYQDDQEIHAINGYSYPIEWGKEKDAIFRESPYFSAWGYGIWADKYLQEQKFSREDIFRYLKKFRNAYQMFRDSKMLFNHAVYIASGKHYLAILDNGELYHMDAVQGIYMYIYQKSVIMPTLSKVRNIGYDGSGQNCKETFKNDNTSDGYNYVEQEIDQNKNFLLDEKNVHDMEPSHVKRLDRYFRLSYKTMIKTWIIWLLKVWMKRQAGSINNIGK